MTEETTMIIENVRDHPCLYDMSHEDFKSAKKKKEAWEEIANTLDIPVEKCRTRYRSLRDTYIKKKREKEARQVTGAIKEEDENEWPYWNIMQSLKSKQSQATNSYKAPKKKYPVAETLEATKSSKTVDDPLLLRAEEILMRKDDKFDIMAKAWATKIRAMGARDQLIVEKKINDVIFEIELSNFQENT